MNKSSKSQTWSQSWTIIGSLLSLSAVAAFLFYSAKSCGSWIPMEWRSLAVGLGAGNIIAITLRLRTLKLYASRRKNG